MGSILVDFLPVPTFVSTEVRVIQMMIVLFLCACAKRLGVFKGVVF